MKESVVAFVEHNRIRHTFESADKFCFRKDRPMLWLQRVCFFVLRKLGAFGTEEVFEVERHVIEPGKFMDALFHQMHTVESFFNYRPKRILIGSAQYAELMHEAVSSGYFVFDAYYCFGATEVCGLKVEVIPWMSGMIVMP